ncbi:hypothetical protein PAXRUDRAFT_830080, partial [Paxillus rubicundulus Ve08.2h10]
MTTATGYNDYIHSELTISVAGNDELKITRVIPGMEKILLVASGDIVDTIT